MLVTLQLNDFRELRECLPETFRLLIGKLERDYGVVVNELLDLPVPSKYHLLIAVTALQVEQ